MVSRAASKMLITWSRNSWRLDASFARASSRHSLACPSAFPRRCVRRFSIRRSANWCTVSHARQNCFSPRNLSSPNDRMRRRASICAALKALAKSCSPTVFGCLKQFMGSPKMKAVAISKDRRPNNGCRSTVPSRGIMFSKVSTGSRKISRSLNHLAANDACSTRLENFHGGPSWVKIPWPSRGCSAVLLGATDQEGSRKMAFKFVGSIVAYDHSPKKLCLRVLPVRSKYNLNNSFNQQSLFAPKINATRSSPRGNRFDKAGGDPRDWVPLSLGCYSCGENKHRIYLNKWAYLLGPSCQKDRGHHA